MSSVKEHSTFSVNGFKTKGILKVFLLITGPLLNWMLGLNKLERLYKEHKLSGLEKEKFAEEVMRILEIRTEVNKDLAALIPRQGSFIIVANHPFGGIEGIILINILSKHRRDLKFMSNSGLRFIRELNGYFIFTNPLVTHNYKNIPSIRACEEHLKAGGLLIFFPAGRTSFFRKDKKRITDGEWNRIAARLGKKTGTPLLPLHFSGHNSRLFINLGRIYYRFRLLMLPREMLKMKGKNVVISAGNTLLPKVYIKNDSRETTEFLRMQTYLQDPEYIYKRDTLRTSKPLPDLIDAVPFKRIDIELSKLPKRQHLHDLNNFSVYYGYYNQLPHTVREITRLRELTFRELDEGSGMECDTDRFDKTYTHLFIVDNEAEKIVGSYRMGQIDRLLELGGLKEIYLTKMFAFDEQFLKSIKFGVEMGRSFLVPEYQRSMYGFFLLWRGIGEFLVRNPQYRTLYGTVSLSNIYDPRSIALIHHVLVKKDVVQPEPPLHFMINPDVIDYLEKRNIVFKELDLLIKTIEKDGKGLPVLVKQYHKLGAKFLSIGRDVEFRNTPGMLLRVDMDSVAPAALKMYMAEGMKKYLEYTIND